MTTDPLFKEKIALIHRIFASTLTENAPEDSPPGAPLQQGKYYGGVYNGRKFMYSEQMLMLLTLEKLEAVIKKQLGI